MRYDPIAIEAGLPTLVIYQEPGLDDIPRACEPVGMFTPRGDIPINGFDRYYDDWPIAVWSNCVPVPDFVSIVGRLVYLTHDEHKQTYTVPAVQVLNREDAERLPGFTHKIAYPWM